MRLQAKWSQSKFHASWSQLSDPHVRDLAWLLSAPNLLNVNDARWQGKIATLEPDVDIEAWLHALDADPTSLHAHLQLGPFERLGRYAEKLLAFYFKHCGLLLAHGVQVHSKEGQTIGEFDFLLRQDNAALHWEFAIKLYLMGSPTDEDCFVGPNLADTLQAKMRKILDRQLALGRHPEAQVLLPARIIKAQALIKGWMFYREDEASNIDAGLSADHCRGFWCAQSESRELNAPCYVILPRLSWLAPVQVGANMALDQAALGIIVDRHFAVETTPLMVAQCTVDRNVAQESSRGFIVPEDWRQRAGQRSQRAVVRPG